MAKTFEVPVEVVETEDGQEVILPSDKEIAESEARLASDEARLSALGKDEADAAERARLEAQIRLASDAIALRKRIRERNAAVAALRRYVLTRPTLRAYQEAEGEATTLDENTGDARLNRTKLILLLVPGHLVGTRAGGRADGEINKVEEGLAPNIEMYLGDKLLAACFPNPALLPF